MTIKDRFAGLEYYGILQFYNIKYPVTPVIYYNPYFSTLIELRTKEGGLKKQWYYNQDRDNPISTISMEMTNKGCGICKVEFSELMFPIDASDIIRLRFAGNVVYEGTVDNDVDVSDPVLTASPMWKRFEELVYSGTFPAGTSVLTILQTVVQSVTSDSGIAWNSSKVTLVGTPPTLEVTYADTAVSEILDSMLELAGSMHYWGVDTSREFFVKRYDETDPVVYRLYSKDKSIYSSAKITEDYSKVKMTEAVVYKKVSGGGEATKIGNIGNSGNTTYPPLPISNKLRRKIGKITASEYLQDATAMSWAYESLKIQANKSMTVKVSDVDLMFYVPKPDDVVIVEADFAKSMEVIVDCNELTVTSSYRGLWSNASIASGQGRDGNSAVKLFNTGTDNSVFDFERPVSFYKQRKVGMFLRAPLDTVFEVAFSNSASPSSTEFQKIGVLDGTVLSYYDFDVTQQFRYIHFKYVTGDIYIDDIQVFCETKRQVQTAIKKVSMKWSDKGIDCDFEGGNIENPETEQYEKLNRKVKILEAINNI